MTNRQLEETLRGAFDRAAPDRFADLPASAHPGKGSVEIMEKTKNNRHIARFAALAATLVLVAGVGYGVRANLRPEAPEMPTFSADTGNGQTSAEPENAAPVAPMPEAPAVPEASEQPEAPAAPLAPIAPVPPVAPTEPQSPTIPSKPVAEMPVVTLTGDRVIEIACAHAGVPKDQIGPMELTMDDDEAVRHFDLKFQYDGAVYFYEIGASDGEILTWKKTASTGTEFIAPPALPVLPTPAPMPVEPQPLTGVVPQDRAVQIALEHAGVTAEQVRDLTAKLDFSDNLGHYRIVFKTDTTEYIYKIHYGAGAIMEWTEADIG